MVPSPSLPGDCGPTRLACGTYRSAALLPAGVQHDAQAVGLGHREQFPLGGSFGQAVFGLETGQPGRAAQVGPDGGARDPPSREVRQPAVQDLAGPDQVLEAGQDLRRSG